jgi:short-subunit dehydrogenase
LDLRNKHVLITGGSSGIGAEIARQLAAHGNRLTLVAHDPERLENTAHALRAGGGAVATELCDFARPAEVDALAARVLASGGADVLINNAGYGVYRTFADEDPDEVDRLLAVNLTAHLKLTKGLVAHMVARRSGAVCFVASLAGRIPITPNATYCAAKYGMFGLAQSLRYELRRFGVEVGVVCPGRVDTPFFDHPTFRERRLGPENVRALSVERVAAKTIRAIESGRAVTYVPASLGLAVWLYEAVPPISRPLYSLLMKDRIERMYADAR